MFGTERMFIRRFEPIEGGYLYHPGRWSRGYLVTEREFQKLREDWRFWSGWRGILVLFALLMGSSTLLLILVYTGVLDQVAFERSTVPLAVLAMALMFWKMTGAQRLVWGREPIAERRTRAKFESDTAKQFSWPLMIFNCLLSTWLMIVACLIAFNSPLIGVPVLLVLALGTFQSFRLARRKWLERSKQS